MHIGTFGDTVFLVSSLRTLTPKQIERSLSARYEEHPVLGGVPRLEFLARNLSRVTLDIQLPFNLGVYPESESEKLTAMCHEGRVSMLSISGINFGRMVIESIEEIWSRPLNVAGLFGLSLQALDMRLSLKEYQ